jgi:tRNA1(Val) A37 N6-methylase TrmN6
MIGLLLESNFQKCRINAVEKQSNKAKVYQKVNQFFWFPFFLNKQQNLAK